MAPVRNTDRTMWPMHTQERRDDAGSSDDGDGTLSWLSNIASTCPGRGLVKLSTDLASWDKIRLTGHGPVTKYGARTVSCARGVTLPCAVLLGSLEYKE